MPHDNTVDHFSCLLQKGPKWEQVVTGGLLFVVDVHLFLVDEGNCC